MSKRKRSDTGLSEEDVRELLPDALRLLGLDIPTSPEAVARAEAQLGQEEICLPDSLKDPFAVLERRPRQRDSRRNVSPSEDVLEELRKVARFGSEIPEDIRSKMNEDRVRAESEAEDRGEND